MNKKKYCTIWNQIYYEFESDSDNCAREDAGRGRRKSRLPRPLDFLNNSIAFNLFAISFCLSFSFCQIISGALLLSLEVDAFGSSDGVVIFPPFLLRAR